MIGKYLSTLNINFEHFHMKFKFKFTDLRNLKNNGVSTMGDLKNLELVILRLFKYRCLRRIVLDILEW